MTPITLKPGDLFGTRNPMLLGRLINAVQFVWSADSKSVYSHSGIIETTNGDTYEALWKIRAGSLHKYIGVQTVIARYEPLKYELFQAAMLKLRLRHDNQIYPAWRIPLHIIPPLAKFLTFKGSRVVCSELVAELEFYLGLRHGQFVGTNPDKLSDEWHRWGEWIIVGEGVLCFQDNQFCIGGE